MYVVNPGKFNPEKQYKCNTILKNYFIYTCNLSVYGETIDGHWIFIKTDKFKECFDNLPIYLKILTVKQEVRD